MKKAKHFLRKAKVQRTVCSAGYYRRVKSVSAAHHLTSKLQHLSAPAYAAVPAQPPPSVSVSDT